MPRKKKNLLIFGNYGGVNWGDEAILSGLLSAIPAQKFAVTVVSSNPRFTKRIHRVNAVSPPPFGLRSFLTKLPDLFGFIKALADARFVIFGGGGLFQDREKKAIFLWSYYFFWTFAFCKTALFVAQSVGPLRYSWSRALGRFVFRHVRFISVRDNASRVLIEDLKIKNKNIVQCSDAIFLSKPLVFRRKKQGTLIMFRGDGQIKASLVRSIIKILPKPIMAVPMDLVDEQLLRELPIKSFRPKSVLDLRTQIAGAELVLSSRLHGNLLALLEATPFIAFSAAPKVGDYFSERGFTSQILPENATISDISLAVSNTLGTSNALRAKMRQVRKREREKSIDIFPHFLL